MESLVRFINAPFNILFFTNTHNGRYLTIFLLSFLTAIIVLFIFKYFSNQEAIKQQKKIIFAYILQIRLYQDQLCLILESIFNIFKHNLLYLRYYLLPLLILLLPIFFVSTQVNNRCCYQPFQPGDEFIIKVMGNDYSSETRFQEIQCQTSQGMKLMTPALRIPEKKTVFWRAKVMKSPLLNIQKIFLHVPGHPQVSKQIAAGILLNRFHPETLQFHPWKGWLFSAEPFLKPEGGIDLIVVDYPRQKYQFLFFQLDGIILFFLLTLFLSFILKRLLNITL